MYLVQDVSGLSKTSNQWQVLKNGLIMYRGSFKEVLKYCLNEFGGHPNAFEQAIPAIIQHGHNTLEFNSKGNLVSSSFQPIMGRKKLG
jgi:hypothetical protein